MSLVYHSGYYQFFYFYILQTKVISVENTRHQFQTKSFCWLYKIPLVEEFCQTDSNDNNVNSTNYLIHRTAWNAVETQTIPINHRNAKNSTDNVTAYEIIHYRKERKQRSCLR